jgi:hypothetical protein
VTVTDERVEAIMRGARFARDIGGELTLSPNDVVALLGRLEELEREAEALREKNTNQCALVDQARRERDDADEQLERQQAVIGAARTLADHIYAKDESDSITWLAGYTVHLATLKGALATLTKEDAE